MEIRPANRDDRARVRAIANDSFRSSFALSPQEIETIVDAEFADEALADRIDAPDARLLVAEDAVEGATDVRGFVDAAGDGTLRWLHVDPDARGQGVGTALFERVSASLRDEGVSITGWALDDAVEGGEFCERFGLQQVGTERLAIGEEEYRVTRFAQDGWSDAPNEPEVDVPDGVTVDGAERPLDRDEEIPGRESPFFPLFTDADADEPYGYFCSQCGSTDVAADGLDRLECGNCGNVHLADEWDGAYL